MKIKIWDLPTRAFHWLLVSAYIGAFFTSRSEWFLEYHTAAGYIALGLVSFRVLWGFAGNRFARFSDFIKGFGEVRDYLLETLKLKPKRYLGHNPAVGWVVLFMLLLTFAISVTGIIVYSGEENKGVFAGLFSFEAVRLVKPVHTFLADFAVFMIIIHISAALFHDFILKENIIRSMITGYKEDEGSWSARVSHLKPGEGMTRLRLVSYLFLVVLGGLGLVYLPPEGKTDLSKLEQPKVFDGRGVASSIPVNETWKAECAESCHSAFHPTLLPAASWRKIMEGREDHYGDSVPLDEETAKEILDYLVSSSAERSTTEASKKMLLSVKEGEVPLRITEIPYWKEKHSEIAEDVFKRKSIVSKSNCIACHPGADFGSFEDKDISIPKD